MAIAGTFAVNFRAVETLDTPENRAGTFAPHRAEIVYGFTDGTTAGQADLCWSDRRTVAASATDTIDLNGGGLTSLGASVAFVKVTAVIVRNRSTTAGDVLHVGPAAVNGWIGPWVDTSDLNAIDPDGSLSLHSDTGWTVTAGSADSIRIIETGGANAVEYDIYILGRSV